MWRKTAYNKFHFLFAFVSVVLLDTTGEASLDWTRYPYGPQANTPGVCIVVNKQYIIYVIKFYVNGE